MSFDAEPDTTSNGNKGNNGRGKGKGQSSTSSVTQSGVITLYSHYDGRQEQGQWQQAGNRFEAFRSLTLLPQANLPYAQVLHQSLSDSKSQLVKASGTKGADASNLFIHHDRLGSAIQVLDETGTQAMRLGYSPFGQVYRKHNDKTQWKINAGVNANKQLGQLMPYQYTGLVHLDARWYNPHASRFVQPDYWNLKSTYLPAEIQHELMRFTGLNACQLLRDPNQQLAYGYVSGNPLVWVDPFGLANIISDWWNGDLDNVHFSGSALNPELDQNTMSGVSSGLTTSTIVFASIGLEPVAVASAFGASATGLIAASMDAEPSKAIITESVSILTGAKFASKFETIAKGVTNASEGSTISNLIKGASEYLSEKLSNMISTPSKSAPEEGC